MFTLTLSSYFRSPSAQEIAHQCCHQLTAVKTGYPLTTITWPNRGLRYRPIEVEYFFEVIRWQDTGFQMIAGSSLIFLNSFEICCVYVSHNENFYFKLTSDAKIQPAATGREDSCFWLFSPCSRVGHALRPIFMLWLVKIWQVSSCGNFMQHLESCLLWQLKLTESCVNLWCF